MMSPFAAAMIAIVAIAILAEVYPPLGWTLFALALLAMAGNYYTRR